jgi:RNA polymerase sigma-70 factor, ECF subfamily
MHCTTSTATPAFGPWSEMLAHRSYLVRFAQRRLHDPMLAEDVVHDVFEAALTGRAVFAFRSNLRTWLTGVLKHKIVDLVRERSRLVSSDESNDGDDGAPATVCPNARPDELAEQRERLHQALQRIDALPPGLRSAMHLSVIEDQPPAAVCRTLAINQTNLYVRLHRARQRLAA